MENAHAHCTLCGSKAASAHIMGKQRVYCSNFDCVANGWYTSAEQWAQLMGAHPHKNTPKVRAAIEAARQELLSLSKEEFQERMNACTGELFAGLDLTPMVTNPEEYWPRMFEQLVKDIEKITKQMKGTTAEEWATDIEAAIEGLAESPGPGKQEDTTEAIKDKIREALDYQTPMGSSFRDWYEEVRKILYAALNIGVSS